MNTPANTKGPKTARFGSISSATMRPCDLIPTFADELEYLNAGSNQDHADLVEQAGELTDYDTDEASEVLSSLFDALNEYAPAYGYFGASEGDGADYGFWPSWDALEELPKVSDTSELAALPADVDEALEVNDHGNATLYARSAIGWSEVWAIV